MVFNRLSRVLRGLIAVLLGRNYNNGLPSVSVEAVKFVLADFERPTDILSGTMSQILTRPYYRSGKNTRIPICYILL